eukprot:1161001-Pelagomonas_calceolata.AAC.1
MQQACNNCEFNQQLLIQTRMSSVNRADERACWPAGKPQTLKCPGCGSRHSHSLVLIQAAIAFTQPLTGACLLRLHSHSRVLIQAATAFTQPLACAPPSSNCILTDSHSCSSTAFTWSTKQQLHSHSHLLVLIYCIHTAGSPKLEQRPDAVHMPQLSCKEHELRSNATMELLVIHIHEAIFQAAKGVQAQQQAQQEAHLAPLHLRPHKLTCDLMPPSLCHAKKHTDILLQMSAHERHKLYRHRQIFIQQLILDEEGREGQGHLCFMKGILTIPSHQQYIKEKKQDRHDQLCMHVHDTFNADLE